MNLYSKHIAIIGAGISGLALGCILKKANIPVIIFEKSSHVSEYGAGISISPNGLKVLKYLGIYELIKKRSGKPLEAIFFSEEKKITSFPMSVITTSRQTLYKALLDNYISCGGEVLFSHELCNINIENLALDFVNGSSHKVLHVAACDGIRSICKTYQKSPSSEPRYSGYSVWRAIIARKQQNIETRLGPNYHIVTYPVDEFRTSFVAAVKTGKTHQESWKAKGSMDELLADLPKSTKSIHSLLDNDVELYKWGVYTRSDINSIYEKNITFLGDAAHPIVPFIGQGGCLALEDAYVFGRLASRFKNDFNKIQFTYQKIRLKRVIRIKNESERQGLLNHLSNPLLVFWRNLMMKYSPIISIRTKYIWGYDPDNEINKIK